MPQDKISEQDIYVDMLKNLIVFISESPCTYSAFYSQCAFKRNGCIKQLCLLTCKLLLALCAPHFLIFRLHFEKQSKKLQSSSPVHFCSRMSFILGSKKAISTSMATTCESKHPIRSGMAQPPGQGWAGILWCWLWEMMCWEHLLQGNWDHRGFISLNWATLTL